MKTHPDTGLNYCRGDESLYRSLLTEYEQEFPEKKEALRRTYGLQDWKEYGVLVHSLKSTSKMVGAGELSDKAASLETAANASDSDAIQREHELMMRLYEAVTGAIRAFVHTPDAKGDPDPEVFEFAPEDGSADS